MVGRYRIGRWPGRIGILCLGCGRETGRHSTAWRCILCRAVAVHLRSGDRRNCGPDMGPAGGQRTDHIGCRIGRPRKQVRRVSAILVSALARLATTLQRAHQACTCG